MQDAGIAAVAILTNPEPHKNKVYNVCGPSYSYFDAAEAFTSTLGKTVEYVQIPYEDAEKSFLDKGWPAWQVKGLMELYKSIDAGTYDFPINDFKTIVGRRPTTIEEWIEAVKAGFQ